MTISILRRVLGAALFLNTALFAGIVLTAETASAEECLPNEVCTYDANGNIASRSTSTLDSSGRLIRRVTRFFDGARMVAYDEMKVEYYSTGRQLTLTHIDYVNQANSSISTFSYSHTGRMLSNTIDRRNDQGYGIYEIYGFNEAGDMIESWHYNYFAGGHHSTVQRYVTVNGHRMVSKEIFTNFSGPAHNPVHLGTRTTDFVYDDVGRIKTKTVTFVDATTTHVSVYDAAGRITREVYTKRNGAAVLSTLATDFLYDTAGGLVKKSTVYTDVDPAKNYKGDVYYDQQGRFVRIVSVRMNGSRELSIDDQRFTYGADGALLSQEQRYTDLMQASNSFVATHHYRPDGSVHAFTVDKRNGKTGLGRVQTSHYGASGLVEGIVTIDYTKKGRQEVSEKYVHINGQQFTTNKTTANYDVKGKLLNSTSDSYEHDENGSVRKHTIAYVDADASRNYTTVTVYDENGGIVSQTTTRSGRDPRRGMAENPNVVVRDLGMLEGRQAVIAEQQAQNGPDALNQMAGDKPKKTPAAGR